VHHVADDGARADDRHLHHEVVEALGPQARQGGHLGAAFDLEDADRVGFLQHVVHLAVLGQMGEVDRAAAPPDHLERVFQERHHAEAEEIHLDDAEGGAVVLVPLDHRAARHRGGLERHHAVEPALTDHHAARVLAEMARQVLDGPPDAREVLNAQVARIAARLAEMRGERIAGILVLPVAHELRQPLDEIGGQRERLADLPRRAPAAIGDDVGGHRRAEPAIALVDVLDDLLAAVAARQVEVDVRPLPALLGEEALEEQLHLYRIDGGESERVAHRAIGGGAAPLHEDLVPAAILDQVPDDEEVAGQIEAPDDVELVGDLATGLVGELPRAVAPPRARLRERAEVADGRLPRRQRIVGELVAQIFEGEAEPE
jgi:hypothetical protein